LNAAAEPAAELRPYETADLAAIVEIYRDAVRSIGPQAYDTRQIAVWSRFPEDPAGFGAGLSEGVTLVAEVDGVPAAFGQLRPADHIQFLYCRGRYARRGLATALLRALQWEADASGARHLTTDASRLSQPLFAREGFVVESAEVVERLGVSFERFRMIKTLRA
jgi:putative acetyltransferase